jgi:hypothetical protein
MALSFMINMLSQTNDNHCDKLLPEWVNHLASVLIMTGEQTVPTKGMAAQLFTSYSNGDILKKDLRKMISIISDNVFDDSTDSTAKSRNVAQSDSESDNHKDRFNSGVIRNKVCQSSLIKLCRLLLLMKRTTLQMKYSSESFKLSTYSRSSIKVTWSQSIDSSMKSMVVYPHHDTNRFISRLQRRNHC